MTMQRTYNRRRAHMLRKKGNWRKPRVDASVNGVYLGVVKNVRYGLITSGEKKWTQEELDVIRNPLEVLLELSLY